MNRPYIFCHMMTSLDGKIMGQYMDTPEGNAAGDVFYEIAFVTSIFLKKVIIGFGAFIHNSNASALVVS